jgi:hypothetical protein
MSLKVWDLITKRACTDASPQLLQPRQDYKVYLTNKTFAVPPPPTAAANSPHASRRWVIGPYTELQRLAVNLRVDGGLQTAFAAAGAGYGRRHTDVPPIGPWVGPVRFRKAEEAAIRNGTLNPIDWSLIDLRKVPGATRDPRRGDRFDLFAEFYQAKTLEAHHIVEKALLATLGLNVGDLADSNAPCVLAACELHQQFYTPEVSPARRQITKGMANEDAAAKLHEIYAGSDNRSDPNRTPGLYESPQMAPLREVADIIIDTVRDAG